MATFDLTIEITTTLCYKCGVAFAMPTIVYNTHLRDGSEFYCPNGHGQVFTETVEQRYNKAKDRILYLENMLTNERRNITKINNKLKKCQEANKPKEDKNDRNSDTGNS